MLAFLRRFMRVLLIILGFLLVALFIWYAGPLFEFNNWRPLDSWQARLYTIAAIIGLWLLYRLIKRLRAYALSDNLVAAVIKQAVPAKAAPSAEALKLRERFEEAASTLKQKRRSGHSLYELPWYVIIGAPGSGKTTALINSGLKFPLEPRGGRALKGVGGTRNCDWWFADEAVFLDTAGRYTTQDSDAASDAEGWAEFLALLRKYRKRRPINGVILTVSAHDLLVQREGQREEHVDAARRRLLELNRELRIQLPVYLMVTKCDLVAGFTEYLDDLSHEGRAQVWGVTFPYEQTRSGNAPELFPAEFDALMERLNQRVTARIEEERDVRRRTRVFAFPQQMAGLRDALAAFVSDVFSSSSFEQQQVLLRGVYLTSGTQEGTPFDRLMGARMRGLGLSAEAVAPAGRGKAYFVERLLKDVMIGESGLAGLDTRGEVAKAALHLGAYAAIVLIAVLGVVAWTVSYRNNRAYLDRVASELNVFRKEPVVTSAAPPPRLLARLNAVRALSEFANQYREHVPWRMSWGLYQGAAIGEAAGGAYRRELDGLLMPHTRATFLQRVKDGRGDPDQRIDVLKAYLMLDDPKHLDREFLGQRGDLEWGQASPGETPTFATHLRSRLADENPLPQRPLDQAAIKQARDALSHQPIARIIYAEIRRQNADPARAVSFEQAMTGAEGRIRRKSGISLSQPLEPVYSKGVFTDVTDTGSSLELVRKYSADSWVLGDSAKAMAAASTLPAEVFRIYSNDYIDTWQRLLTDFELSPTTSAAELSRTLEILSSPASPIRGLVNIVVDHTRFTPPPPPPGSTGIIDSVTKTVRKATAAVQEVTGAVALPHRQRISARFERYHKLTEGEIGKAPIDRLIDLYRQLNIAWINSPSGDIDKKGDDPAVKLATSALRQEALTLPPELQLLVEQLPKSIDDVVVVEKIRLGTERVEGERAESEAARAAERKRLEGITQLYQQRVLPECRRIVAGRYPFTQGSDNDLPLLDFARLFGAGGVLDGFFQTYLVPYADTATRPWRWQTGAASETLPADMLRLFQNGADVREAFFPGGAKVPAMQFTLRLLDFDQGGATRFRLNIEGVTLDSMQQRQGYGFKWPGEKNAGFVQVQFEGRFSTPVSRDYHGAWAWFRLLEESKLSREADTRNDLTVTVGGHSANLVVEAHTVNNPFATGYWQRFKCGS